MTGTFHWTPIEELGSIWVNKINDCSMTLSLLRQKLSGGVGLVACQYEEEKQGESFMLDRIKEGHLLICLY